MCVAGNVVLFEMNYLDIILAVPLCVFLWRGWRRGLIYEVSTLVGLVVGTWAAVRFSCQVAQWLHIESDHAVLVAFFITFVAVVALSYLLGKCIERLLKLVKVGFMNNLLGALASMLVGVCMLSVLIYYVEIIDRHEVILKAEAKQSSVLYKPINAVGNKTIGGIKQYVNHYRQQHPEAHPKVRDAKGNA